MLTRLAELFPASRFTGMDLSTDATAVAQREASTKGLTNIRFIAVDLTDFDTTAEPESFDFVTTFDGFSSVETHQLAHDIQNNWYVVRKG